MISLIPLRENSDVDLNELGDQMRDLLGEDTIVRLADEGGTVIAEVA